MVICSGWFVTRWLRLDWWKGALGEEKEGRQKVINQAHHA